MKKNKQVYYFEDQTIAKEIAPTCGATPVDTKYFRKNPSEFSNSLFLLRGITNHKYCEIIKSVNSNFFYIDTGYFGNINGYFENNPSYKKCFHRMVYNKLQNDKLTFRDDIRYKIILKFIENEFEVTEQDFLKPWKKEGKYVLICPPSNKVARIFNIDNKKWIEETSSKIKKYTSRKIIVRAKPEGRSSRVLDPIQTALDKNVFILVTYNSIAATEAIIHGVPALTLGLNAATPVSINDISKIDSPIYPDRQQWLNNLAYGQFHISEFQNGTFWEYLKSDLGW